MLQRDYLMRMIHMMVEALLNSVTQRNKKDPDLACRSIEDMLGEVTEMDPDTLLSLSPESIGTILDLGGMMHDSTAELVVRGLILEADILRNEKNYPELADLRFEQARGIAATFHLDFEYLCQVLDEEEIEEISQRAENLARGIEA